MSRIILLMTIFGTWGAAYSDWLAPGWLRFGLPASLTEPLTTVTTYDLGCGLRLSARKAMMRGIESQLPDWVEVWHWDFNPFDNDSKADDASCRNIEDGKGG